LEAFREGTSLSHGEGGKQMIREQKLLNESLTN
jgi:hypothetical protein